MSRLVWDRSGEREYETGIDHGVLFVYHKASGSTPAGYGAGVEWNGLTGVSESPSGAEPTALWADNIKYLNLMSAEEFGGTITCYMYPVEWKYCDGEKNLIYSASGTDTEMPGVSIGQQSRSTFALSYRTLIGNDTESNDHGYKLHLVYGCLASPSQKDYKTVNDNPEGLEFSFEFKTTPVEVPGFKPTATVTIDSTCYQNSDTTAADAKIKLTRLEDFIYGTDANGNDAATTSALPMPADIPAIMNGTYVAG